MFIVVGLLVGIGIAISKPKGYLGVSPPVRQPSLTVTSNTYKMYVNMGQTIDFFKYMLMLKAQCNILN